MVRTVGKEKLRNFGGGPALKKYVIGPCLISSQISL